MLKSGCAIFVCGLSLAVFMDAAYSSDGSVTLNQVQDAVVQVSLMKDQALWESHTGENLDHLTSKIDPNKIDDATLMKIESLLDSKNDLIRYWGAIALGNLGPRAKPAVPKLLQTFRISDCLNGPITSADAILDALKRIGVEPPSRSCPRMSG